MGDSYSTEGVVRFRGRTYVLFRRSQKPGSPLCFRVQVDGKRRLVSTGTGDMGLARAKAKVKLADLLDGTGPTEPAAKASKAPTIGEILDAYDNGPQLVREQTAKDYRLALLKMFRVVKGMDEEAARRQPVTVLDDTFVEEFQALRQNRRRVDYSLVIKENTAANSCLRQARALFSRRSLLAYEKAGLNMPDSLAKFLRVPFLTEPSHRYSDNPIPKEQIDELNRQLPEKKKQDDRLWAIHLMIRLMGMRDSEIERARKEWLVKIGDRTFLVINRRSGQDAPKRSEGRIPVPPELDQWFREQPGEYLIPARNPTERHNLIYKIHSKWVGSVVTGRTKTNHELRKWAGSVVATKTNSWERAAEFLRIDIETAKRHYLAFTTPSQPLGLDDLEG